MPNDAPDWTSFNVAQVQILAPTSVAQDGLLHALVTATIPANTHSIEVYWQTTGGAAMLALNVVGQTTNYDYAVNALSRFTSITGSNAILRYRQVVDAKAAISIQFQNLGGSAKVWAVAMTDTSLVTDDAGQAGSQLIISPASQVAAAVDTERKSEGQLHVSLSSANPAAWQAANQPPIQFSAQLAAGTNVQLIAAPGGGQKIYLHEISYYYTATSASFGAFRRASGGGTQIDAWNSNSAQFFPKDYKGAPLGVGEALFLSNDSGVNMAGFFNGHIAYSVDT